MMRIRKRPGIRFLPPPDDADAESTDDEGAESADDEDTEETGDSVSSAPENKGPGSSGEDAGPMKTTK